MIFHLTVILGCQLAGELIAAAAGLPLPGPVLGMVILFAGLMFRGLPRGLATVADALLGNLSLLFVPAGVGVMLCNSSSHRAAAFVWCWLDGRERVAASALRVVPRA